MALDLVPAFLLEFPVSALLVALVFLLVPLKTFHFRHKHIYAAEFLSVMALQENTSDIILNADARRTAVAFRHSSHL